MPADGRTGFGSENSFKRVALTRAQKNGRSESSVAESRSVRADLRDPHSNAYGICKSDRVGFAGANWHTAKTQAGWVQQSRLDHSYKYRKRWSAGRLCWCQLAHCQNSGWLGSP